MGEVGAGAVRREEKVKGEGGGIKRRGEKGVGVKRDGRECQKRIVLQRLVSFVLAGCWGSMRGGGLRGYQVVKKRYRVSHKRRQFPKNDNYSLSI